MGNGWGRLGGPAVLAATQDVDGIYYDKVSQIHMERWSKGRTALIDDAAGAVSLLAVLEASVLAGELSRAERIPPPPSPASKSA